jgi:hypothetical protein
MQVINFIAMLANDTLKSSERSNLEVALSIVRDQPFILLGLGALFVKIQLLVFEEYALSYIHSLLMF